MNNITFQANFSKKPLKVFKNEAYNKFKHTDRNINWNYIEPKKSFFTQIKEYFQNFFGKVK